MDDEVDPRYLCPVCCEVLKAPLLTDCGHSFCEECLQEAVKRQQQCPVCRRKLSTSSCQPDHQLAQQIAGMCVECVACGQKCSLLHFNSHTASCAKRTLSASCSCSSQVPHPQPKHQGPNRSTFTCPLCQQPNLDCSSLVEHCNSLHQGVSAQVVCPVCAAMPWGDLSRTSINFIQHLNLRHKFEYDTFVDFEQDDDQTLHSILEASIFEQ